MERPRILGIATAVPDHVITQSEARDHAKAYFTRLGYMEAIYDNAGVETRYACAPIAWHLQPHGWADRAALFQGSILALFERVARACAERGGIALDEIDAILTVSSTGIAIPSPEATLINRLGLRDDVQRLPIFGLGCAGGALGVARAAAMAKAAPGTTVLLLVAELCCLNFRLNDFTKTNFVTTALFGDGAAGLLIRVDDDPGPLACPAIVTSGEITWPNSEDVMGFSVEDDGLGVVLRPDVPGFTREHLRPATERFLARHGLGLDDLDGFLFHPGGRKILDAIQDSLGLVPEQLAHSRSVLRRFGNMSAPTVLFVLDHALADGAAGRHLLAAFGPGFSAGFSIIDIPGPV